MSDYAVLVPWQDNGCEHRTAALAYVGAQITTEHGGYTLAELPADQPWSKGAAVAHALPLTYAPVLVVWDGDCLVNADAVCAAVNAVTSGRTRWAIPHTTVHRIDRASTAAVYAGGSPWARWRHERPPYRGVEAGGIVVIDRALYNDAPIDSRFHGWSCEDLSAAIAWRSLAGAPWRGTAPLVHLYHPRPPSISPAVGSRASKLLHIRYNDAAKHGPEAMRALIAEGRSTLPATTT